MLLQSKLCEDCPEKKYSLEINAPFCKECHKGGTCKGLDVMYINKEYWRSHNMTGIN